MWNLCMLCICKLSRVYLILSPSSLSWGFHSPAQPSDWLFQDLSMGLSRLHSQAGTVHLDLPLCTSSVIFASAITSCLWTLNCICHFIARSHSRVFCCDCTVVLRVWLQTHMVLFLNIMNYFIINELFHNFSHHFHVVHEHNKHTWRYSNTVRVHKQHYCLNLTFTKTITNSYSYF